MLMVIFFGLNQINIENRFLVSLRLKKRNVW